MEAYNHTLDRLFEEGFEVVPNVGDTGIGIKCFSNGSKFVILQRWEITTTIQRVNEEASILRDSLLRNRMNAWNAYYLICEAGDHPISEEIAYSIERDPKALRKYVIRSALDLQRIPFLDSEELTKKEASIELLTSIQMTKTITQLIEYIRQHDGERRKLNQKELETAIIEIEKMDGGLVQ
ncbi:ABC-three component system middle component 1 [Paenibacillus sp. NRS-1760]|uniref:ABC-three component system middle component 1 n=1 Tax=Paenibacillus sp. NRS-1760 TaxID=3233902 RepID=UPI003D28C4F1